MDVMSITPEDTIGSRTAAVKAWAAGWPAATRLPLRSTGHLRLPGPPLLLAEKRRDHRPRRGGRGDAAVLHLSLEPGEPARDVRMGLERLGQRLADRSEEHTSELQSLMRISYAVF